ncbi:MAG TPA: hypothetical protein DCL77_15140 [Prolixibacteraceae bacterium]|jgi:hypothetical protein|nr:hypothetical protein [Prolixibacteraceae bacterium]
MRHYILFIITLFLFTGCVEDFDLKLQNTDPRLVVEGLITNKPGPYYISLTKSKTGTFTVLNYNYINNAELVRDATVIISDDFGQLDTLKLIQINDNSNSRDKWFKGSYKTSKLIGIPGHTYSLKIKVWNKEFKALSYMPPVPDIDSLRYFMKTAEKDGQEYYIPLLNFKEPQGIDNYYLVQLKDEFSLSLIVNTYIWQYSIFSDIHLKPYVSNLNISLGANPRGITYPHYWEGDSIYVALSSLSKEAYIYYKALLDQFENDGGAYKPTPTSPLGNISNGGLGLFRASAFSEKRTKIQKTSNLNLLPMK